MTGPIPAVSAVITILAILVYFSALMNVGRMRGKHKIDAPAMTGNPEFERAVRVQANMLEAMPMFLPLLWISTYFFSPAMTMAYLGWLPAALGIVWVVGRYLYMTGYMAAPEKRSTGFLISALGVIGLLICSIIGVVMAFMATSAT